MGWGSPSVSRNTIRLIIILEQQYTEQYRAVLKYNFIRNSEETSERGHSSEREQWNVGSAGECRAQRSETVVPQCMGIGSGDD